MVGTIKLIFDMLMALQFLTFWIGVSVSNDHDCPTYASH